MLFVIIGVLVIGLITAIVFVFRKGGDCPNCPNCPNCPACPTRCNLTYAFETVPNTQFYAASPGAPGQNALSQDTQSLQSAQQTCFNDINCASFVRAEGINYYFGSSAPIMRAEAPQGQNLYVKQSICGGS